MHIDYNIRSILLFVAMVQGLVIAALLIGRGIRKRREQDYLLSWLLFYLVCSLIEHFIGFLGVYDYAREAGHDLTYFPFSNKFFWGPLIWLYVQSLTDAQFVLKKRQGLHFLAPLLFYALHFIVWFLPMSVKGPWFDSGAFRMLEIGIDLVFYGQIFLYLYWSLHHYRAYRRLLETEFSNTARLTLFWLRNFLYGFSAYMLIDLLFNLVSLFRDLRYVDWYWLELTRAVHLYYISMTGWSYAQKSIVPFAMLEQREEKQTIAENQSDNNSGALLQPVPKTMFNPAESAEKCRLLTEYMTQQQPWLDPELTLSQMAAQTGLNTSQLSWLINKGFGKNFNDFVNEYRVQAMIAHMKDPAYQHLSLLGIAFESGFNSKATFNRAFKKTTGMAPSAYFE